MKMLPLSRRPCAPEQTLSMWIAGTELLRIIKDIVNERLILYTFVTRPKLCRCNDTDKQGLNHMVARERENGRLAQMPALVRNSLV